MRTEARVVVIGGGVIGCSILYHLAKLGWSDVVLLERDELTSGSTWHAAANIHGLHDSTNISRIQHYTMNLYKELEAETGQSCGVFQPGSLYLAQTEAREHQLRLQAAKAKLYGMNFYEISRDEARALQPAGRFRRHPLHHVRARWRQRRPVGRDQRLCRGRASARRRDTPFHPGNGDRAASRTAVGSCVPRRATSAPDGW